MSKAIKQMQMDALKITFGSVQDFVLLSITGLTAQQENGPFVLKRLLVASMACVLAWRLAASQAPQAAEARQLVMRLSGRQVEHGKTYTLEGLVAGMWVLLALRTVLQRLPASRLQELADFVLGGSVMVPTTTVPRPRRAVG